MKTPNPDNPIRNTLKHLALGLALGIALLAPASAAPPVTTGLKLHLDASQLTGLSDGATVTTWTDMSGLGNNAAAAGTPIYKPGVLNGEPVIRFDNASSFTTANLSASFALPDPNPTAANTGTGGTALDGTYVNTPTRGVAGALVGDADTATTLNGSTQYVNIPYSADLNPPQGQPWSAEIWAKSNVAGTLPPFSSGTPGNVTNRQGWVLYFINADLSFRAYTNNATNATINGGTGLTIPGLITPSTWYHVVITCDGTDFKIFLNGVQVGTTPTVGPNGTYSAGTTGTALGFRLGAGNAFNGALDEAAFYTTSLSQPRIQAHYENGINAPARTQSYDLEIALDSPVAHYKLNEPAAPVAAATGFIVTTIDNDDAYTLVKANPGVDEWWRYNGNGLSYPGFFRGNRLEGYCAMPTTGSHLFAISSSPSAWEMSINGTSQGVAGGNFNAGGALVIGNGSSGAGLKGDIAELILYNRVLTAEETNAVGYYLAGKYGISSTYENPNPTAPENLQAIASDGAVSLTWKAFPGAVSYKVKRSETPGSGYTVVGTPTGPSFTDSPLVNGTPYYYVVSAVLAGPSESGDSTEKSATPTGVNATLSTVTSSQPAQRADGVASITITVTLRNSSNTPIPGKVVTLEGTGSPVITTVMGTTGADGKAIFTATSTTVGTAVFTATDTTDSNLVIVPTAAVDFIDPNTPESINVNFTGGTAETASTLSGPAGGLGAIWNQFMGPASPGTLVDSIGAATTVTITSNFGLPGTFDGAVIALPMLRGSMTNFGKGVDNTNVTINGLEAGGFYNIWMVTLRNQGNGGGGTEQYVGWWSTTNATSSLSNQLVNAVGPTVNTSTFVAGYNYVLFQNVEANGSGQIVFTGVAGPLLDGSNNNHRHGLNGLQIEKTTPPVIGIVTDNDSTVAASPATVFADGVLTSTVTVTLKDANGTGVPGKEVTLANTSGPKTATINPLTAVTTNGAGQAVFTVSSATPGIEVFTATDVTDTLTLTDTASVEFVEVGVLTDAAKSTVVASPTARLADGLSTSTITVTLRDANGFPVSGNNVTLANSGGTQAATISPLGAVTSNASGQAVFSVSSSTIGAEEFTATDTTDTIGVTQIATVNFIDPNAPKLISVNFAGPAAEVESTLSGPAGGLGTAWNQLLNISNASGTLQDSTGTMTTVSISHNYNLFADDAATTLPIYQAGVANFGKGSGSPATVTLSGLASGGIYDIWLVSLRNQPFGGDGTEQYYGNWSTTNATSSSGSQLLDAVDPTLNTSTFVAGYNYVLFENVVADGSGNIVFTSTPADSEPGVTHRLGLNGIQIQEVTAPPEFRWKGADGGNWTDVANWNNTVPGAADIAILSDSDTAGQTLTLDADAAVAGLTFNNLVANQVIASPAGKTLTLATVPTLSANLTVEGTHSISAKVDISSGTKLGPGTVNLSGTVAAHQQAGSASNIAMFVSNGVLGISGTTTVDPGKRVRVDGSGTLEVTGVLNTAGPLFPVGSGGSTATATVILKGSGQWTQTHSGGGDIAIGISGANNGRLIIQDTAQLNTAFMVLGFFGPGAGTVQQNGGTVTLVTTPADYTALARPALWIGVSGPGDYHLNSGTLKCGTIGGSGKLYFNGGTLVANMDDLILVDPGASTAVGQTSFMQGLNQVVVQSGAVIDTAGHIITIAQNLEHDFSGPAIDGGLTKKGLGTLTLLQASCYTGPTKVQGGTLACATAASVAPTALEIDAAAKVDLTYTGNRNIPSLKIGVNVKDPGVYGSSSSPAPLANQDDVHFAGTGTVTVGGSTGFTSWAADNAPGQTPGEDYDNDGVENGVEYFMGQTGSSFTAMPGLDGTNKVTWTMDSCYFGTYEVQTSSDLVDWTNVDPRPLPSSGSLSYTLPADAPGGKSFVRLLVTPAP